MHLRQVDANLRLNHIHIAKWFYNVNFKTLTRRSI